MVATFVMVAALTAGYEPLVHKTPGPAFKIPCKVDGAQAVDRVQLFVSDNRGKTWTLHEEITPDKTGFTFLARKPGEYWFTARLKKKDGTFDPAKTEQFVVMQRVEVEMGTGVEPTFPPAVAKPTAAEVAKELDDELTRVEMALIRQEIKKLSEAKKLTPEAGDKIDRLRDRLRSIQVRIRSDREDTTPGLRNSPPFTVYPSPYVPPPTAPDDRRIPHADLPTGPIIPPAALPAAPMPRVREQR